MDIVTQDVYLPVEIENATGDVVNIGVDEDFKRIYLQKFSDMVVMTKEELKKAIGDAFNAGMNRGVVEGTIIEEFSAHPNKETYLKSIFK